MAYYQKLEGPAMQAFELMVSELFGKAKKELKLDKPDLVLRPLRPEDIGLTTPKFEFNIATADAWNTLIDNKAIADNRFVGINGVLYAKSAQGVVAQLEIKRAGDVKRYWQIQDINYWEDATVFFDDPVLVDQNQPINIRAYATATSSTERICFLGAVVEKRGLLIK